MRKPYVVSLVMLFAVFMVVCGCGGNDQKVAKETGRSSQTGQAPEKEGKFVDPFRVKWGPDYTSLDVEYSGGTLQYAEDMIKQSFPAPGEKPDIKFEEHWPLVLMRARWSESLKDWPPKYRSQALDIVLMFASDAQLYESIFPKLISSSEFTFPPRFLNEAKDSCNHNLVEVLRGEVIGYEVTAKAGFGASDYKIKTKIRIGLSEDGKTFFYHDSPAYISDYLESRDFLLAAHNAGDRINYEAVMACVCAPRGIFRDEAMGRVEESGRYFVDRLYECLKGAPSEKEIDDYLEMVRKGERGDVRALIEYHKSLKRG